MATKTVPEAPEIAAEPANVTLSEEEQQARETAILARWEAAELTIREAAEQLGLNYGEFLDLLATRGIPVERGPLDLDTIQAAVRQLRGTSR
jgi:hypothetical protein